MNENEVKNIPEIPTKKIYEIITCPCGRKITKQNFSSHIKTTIHKNYLELRKSCYDNSLNAKIDEIYDFVNNQKKNSEK